MPSYAVVIEFSFENGERQSIVLDTIEDVKVGDTSDVTEHPMISGDIVADHMIRRPVTISISGNLSTSSSTTDALLVINNKVDIITSQEIFTKIKNEAALCEIYKILMNNEKDIRFMRRSNMVLTSIEWTEKTNSVDFTFGFREVILSTFPTYNLEEDDAFLPNVTVPETKSFTETAMDWDSIYETIWRVGLDAGLITHDFQVALSGLGKGALMGLGLGTVIVGILIKFGAISLISWPTAIIAGIAIVAVAITTAIISFVKSSKYRIAQFKSNKDIPRFGEFVGNIGEQLKVLDTRLKVYQLVESGEQECLLTIDNTYYDFIFKKNNISGKYGVEVYDLNDVPQSTQMVDITSAPTGFGECTSEGKLFEAAEGSFVYILCPSENEDGFVDKNDLKNYYILVATGITPETFMSKVQQIITQAILY